MRKLVYFSRKPDMDRHTYKHTYNHNLRLRPHKRPLRPHNYVPHTKAFGNNSEIAFQWQSVVSAISRTTTMAVSMLITLSTECFGNKLIIKTTHSTSRGT